MAMECMTKTSICTSEESKLVVNNNTTFGGSSETMVPENFIWPDEFKAKERAPDLEVPHIDLEKFMSGNEREVEEIMRMVDEACRKHGFFLVVNHGVDLKMMEEVHKCTDEFFALPLCEKQRVRRKLGDHYGYSNSFFERFSSMLPWKESFSVRYLANNSSVVDDYVSSSLGQQFPQHGKVYQEYCEAMDELCMKIVELLAMSLGLPREEFKKFYEDNDSIMRLNYYPPCDKPELTLGTGPHCDPTSITILHQDHVSGLQVCFDDQWQCIPPTQDAFVVNIGDTFMALTNGVYKSCVHRAVVNSKEARKSVVFFLSPASEKVVRAPEELVEKNPPRRFPDFTWPMLLKLTAKMYRPDCNTLQAFTTWLQNQNNLGTTNTTTSSESSSSMNAVSSI